MAGTPEEVSKAPEAGATSEAPEIGGRYASYVLVVLVLVYVFNFIDRQIISILAEQIKADLGLSDAQIGFLYGTAFAVFYAVFGIPLGKLADVWTRKSLISIGLSFWSVMTALSGLARNFFALGTFRIGVGIGEASATPAAFSMLCDYFPPALRATALAIYSSGVYIGAGIGLFLGGIVSESWNAAFPDRSGPYGLVGWHVAFFVVGLPGLLMALWVRSLREPVRGQSEGIVTPRVQHPFGAFGRELAAVLPGLSLWSLKAAGAGSRGVGWNVATAVGLALAAWLLIEWLGTPAQWIALAIGLYAAASWVQGLGLRDRASAAMIFRSRALVAAVVGYALLAFPAYGLGFWAAPFFMRVHGVSAAEAGTILGLIFAVAGWAGVTCGGVIGDRLRRRTPRGRLWIGLFAATFPVPVAIWMLLTEATWIAYLLNFLLAFSASAWIGPAAATVNDLVMPRMRAMASAFYILVITFIGLALGPYTIGRLSVAFEFGRGLDAGEALRTAMLLSLLVNGGAIAALLVAWRHLPREEADRLERARAAGEPV
jgi:MFS family permease